MMKKSFLSSLSRRKMNKMLLALLVGGLIFSCNGQNTNGTQSTIERIDQKLENEAKVIFHEHAHVDVKEGYVENYSYSHATQDTWQVVCGHTQSPIHIQSKDTVAMRDAGLIDVYKNVTLKSVTDEKTTLFADAKASTSINGRSFDLIQFHLHSPAEHIIDGVTYDLELHYVHVSQSGRLAVLGIMIKEGEFNPAFQILLDSLKDPSKVTSNFDVTPLFPKNLNYYHYLGSLTTPPLSENVEWHVFAEPVEISKEQLAEYRAHEHYNNTARHTQPLNGRSVLSANALGLK